jgi:hypothetical protein
MQDIWYGDRRDRVKWGALVHLARTQRLSKIIQVAFYRSLPNPELDTDEGPVPLPKEVWNHFSNLRNIQKLKELTDIEILVLDRTFEPGKRRQYVRDVIQDLRQYKAYPKVVFLDPDTGIEPKVAKPEHVTIKDVKEIWDALEPNDWLALYQHAAFTKEWLKTRRQKFKQACGVELIKTFQGKGIAADIAVFAAQKTPA